MTESSTVTKTSSIRQICMTHQEFFPRRKVCLQSTDPRQAQAPPSVLLSTVLSSRITTVIRIAGTSGLPRPSPIGTLGSIMTVVMSLPQFTVPFPDFSPGLANLHLHGLILKDKHMTAGRINQVTPSHTPAHSLSSPIFTLFALVPSSPSHHLSQLLSGFHTGRGPNRFPPHSCDGLRLSALTIHYSCPLLYHSLSFPNTASRPCKAHWSLPLSPRHPTQRRRPQSSALHLNAGRSWQVRFDAHRVSHSHTAAPCPDQG